MKKYYCFVDVLVSLFAMVVVAGPTSSAETTALDEKCAEMIKKMADYLEAQPEFSLAVEVADERLTISNEKIEIKRSGKAVIKRSNKMKMEATQGEERRELFYDGAQLTLVDTARNLYARAAVSGSNTVALDYAMDELDFTMPLADFIVDDLYKNFTTNVETSEYIGITTIEDVACHHLAFEQEEIDWQMWIEDGVTPLPKKLIITYKHLPLAPEFRVIFVTWDFTTEIPDETFIFVTPQGAEEVEFITIAEDEEEIKENIIEEEFEQDIATTDTL